LTLRTDLRRAVRASQMSLYAIAKAAGIDYSTASRWLRDVSTDGRPVPVLSDLQMQAVADAIGARITVKAPAAKRRKRATATSVAPAPPPSICRESDTPGRGKRRRKMYRQK